MIVHIIEAVYHFLWGDLVTLHLSGTSIGIPLLVLLLIPTGIYFTFRTNFVSVRLFSYLPLPGLVWEIWWA